MPTENKQPTLWQNLTQQKWFQFLLVILFGWLLYIVIRKVKRDSKILGTNTQNDHAATTLQTSGGQVLTHQQAVNRVLELREIAANCSKAIWSFSSYLWGAVITWRLDEDEDLLIQELNKTLNATEAALVSDFYREYNSQWDTATLTTGVKGMSLKADVNKYLSSSERARIKSYALNALK